MILLQIFKNSRTTGLATVFLLLAALFIPSFIQNTPLSEHTGMPLYSLLFGTLHLFPFLNRVITILLFLLVSYMLVRIGVRYVLLETRSLMPAIFLVIFSMTVPEARHLNPALIGSLFYLFSFAMLFDVHDKKDNTLIIFNAALVLALGCLFYLKLIWFLPLFWLGVITMKPATWRELLYPVLAFFLLALLLFTWYWGIQGEGQELARLVSENLTIRRTYEAGHYSEYIFFGYVALLVGLASIYMVNRFQIRKTFTQNIYQVLFYMFVAGILFYVFVARFDPASLVFIAFPVSIILANYFHRSRSHWSHEVMLWVLLALAILVQFTHR